MDTRDYIGAGQPERQSYKDLVLRDVQELDENNIEDVKFAQQLFTIINRHKKRKRGH